MQKRTWRMGLLIQGLNNSHMHIRVWRLYVTNLNCIEMLGFCKVYDHCLSENTYKGNSATFHSSQKRNFVGVRDWLLWETAWLHLDEANLASLGRTKLKKTYECALESATFIKLIFHALVKIQNLENILTSCFFSKADLNTALCDIIV